MVLAADRRPGWLNKKISLKKCRDMKGRIKDLRLNTVCEEAGCPNISECFSKDTATFMILGKICTRDCSFCGIEKGQPSGIDRGEPERVAEAVDRLKLRHAVVTSVTRDDLDDGGAELFARTILAIRGKINKVTVEVLIPDFKGDEESVRKITEAGPEVIDHNLETVPRLYKKVRPRADYKRSLKVLRKAKEFSDGSKVRTKSGLMLGLGETAKEVLAVFSDLRNIGCDFLSMGQYLAPSRSHYPVKEHITLQKFLYYKEKGLDLGFLYVASGPYVRSSYCASEYFNSL